MFVINHRVKAAIPLAHYHFKEVTNDSFIYRKVKEAFEGRAIEGIGLIVQIIPKKDSGIALGNIKVLSSACVLQVFFECICFKVEKGDVLDIRITEVSKDCLIGKFGHIAVKISSLKMPEVEYDSERNAFLYQTYEGSFILLDVGQIIRVRCYQVELSPGGLMQLMCETDDTLLCSRNVPF